MSAGALALGDVTTWDITDTAKWDKGFTVEDCEIVNLPVEYRRVHRSKILSHHRSKYVLSLTGRVIIQIKTRASQRLSAHVSKQSQRLS